MRWFERQRLIFIRDTVTKAGFINRADIVEEFGVSVPTASADLQKFISLYPGAIAYNPHSKRYESIT